MKSNHINWLAIFLEAFFVVLGVVLALAASNWREDNNKKQRAETALQSIIEELNANHEAVSVAINYHGHLMDTLYKHMGRYAQEPERHPKIDVFNKGFTNPAVPLSRAWEAATATGIIENMPYEQVLLISQVYKNQEQYEIQSRSIGQQIYGRMFDDGLTGILRNYQNLVQIIGSFVYTECGLASEYASVLPQLRQDSSSLVIPRACQYVPER